MYYFDNFHRSNVLAYQGKVYFTWLDKDDIPARPENIYSCRGIFNVISYKCREELFYGTSPRKDFEMVHEYVNICLVFRPEFIEEIKIRINYLNSVKSRFGIQDDFVLTELDWKIFNCDTYKCYKLNGNIIWKSSAPIVSFFMGIIKYGINAEFIYHPGNKEQFIDCYSKSDLCTNNLDLIIQEYSKNYDKLHKDMYGAHNFGASDFTNKWFKLEQAEKEKNKILDDYEKLQKLEKNLDKYGVLV